MKTFFDTWDKWGVRVASLLAVIIFTKTCNTNSKIRNNSEKIEILSHKIDTTNVNIKFMTEKLRKEIKIEGLKAEKRMIQSTDRKIMDVNRQSEIDKELSNLEK